MFSYVRKIMELPTDLDPHCIGLLDPEFRAVNLQSY
jgi:hypothetical protein